MLAICVVDGKKGKHHCVLDSCYSCLVSRPEHMFPLPLHQPCDQMLALSYFGKEEQERSVIHQRSHNKSVVEPVFKLSQRLVGQ